MAIDPTNIGIQRALAPIQEHPGRQIRLASSDGPSFSDTLTQALGEVSELQDRSRDAIATFLRGDPIEVHEVMAAAEEAGIALDALIQVRNKLTEAYRSVMQMQS